MTLGQFKGDVVMINFWASWCGPCRQEMPLLDDIYKQYKDMGFVLLGVNVEPTTRSSANGWLKKTPVSYPILYDPKSAVSQLYQVQAKVADDGDHRPPGRRALRAQRLPAG